MATTGRALGRSKCFQQVGRSSGCAQNSNGADSELSPRPHLRPFARLNSVQVSRRASQRRWVAALPAGKGSQWLGGRNGLRPCPKPERQQRNVGGTFSCRAAEGPDKLCRDQVNVVAAVAPDESVAERVKVTLLGAKGSAQVIEVPTDVYILDSAIDNDIDLPWSCRGGICGTCVGKVVKGSVDQSDISDLEFVLDEESIQAGMALLCMARPNEDCTIETQSDWGYLMGFQEWKGASGNIGETVAADWKSISDV